VWRGPERFTRKILGPCVHGKFLRRLAFMGLDNDGAIRAQLVLEVDWLEHGRLAAVQGRLIVDGRSMQQGAPEVQGLLNSFEDAVVNRGLQVTLVLYLRRDQDTAEVWHRLVLRDAPGGFGLAAPRKRPSRSAD
jgi:hypothetical protein